MSLCVLGICVFTLLTAVVSDNTTETHEENVILAKVAQLHRDFTAFEATESLRSLSGRDNSNATQSRSNFIVTSFTKLFESLDIFEFFAAVKDGVNRKVYCAVCQFSSRVVLSSLFTKTILSFSLKQVCFAFKLQKTHICSGIIDSFKNDLDAIKSRTKLGGDEICGLLLGIECAFKVTKNLDWTLNIPPKAKAKSRTNLKSARSLNADNSGQWDDKATGCFIQITDIHLDHHYTPDANADCKEPLCCRPSDERTVPEDEKAGHFADYRHCDMSISVLEQTLKRVSQVHPEAMFYIWTGDIAAHNVWSVSRDEVKHLIRESTKMFLKYQKQGVKIYPALGNHEAVPVNSFAPPEVKGRHSISWLYEFAAREWSQFLPEEALITFRRGGHYKVDIASDLILLNVNSNYGARLNPYIFLNPVDAGDQLKWLRNQLIKAEGLGQKAYIMMHIPPDNRECTQGWLFNYIRIVERFEAIIAGQFYGHTHNDEIRVMYSLEEKTRPIGVQIISPAITSYSHTNPSYRLFQINDKGLLVNHKTYFVNVTEANLNPEQDPEWIKGYDARSFYNMSSLQPKEWDDLVTRLETDDDVFFRFYRNYVVNTDYPEMLSCGAKCKEEVMSKLRVGDPFSNQPRPFNIE